jgi:DNA-binding SARP family transcriptional activator
MAVRVRLALLGPARVAQAGQSNPDLARGKPLALLGYLVAQRLPLSRVRVASLLWPDLPIRRARANLSWTLHKLSAGLPGCFEGDRYSLWFARPNDVWIDLDALDDWIAQGGATALAKATGLYRGEFLQDLSLNNCPEYELWLVRERERWRRRTTTALADLVTDRRQRGKYREGLQLVRRLLILEPWREDMHREAMRLLIECGQRCTALIQYEACCRCLQEELGIRPSTETVSLYLRIRDGGTEGPGTPPRARMSEK